MPCRQLSQFHIYLPCLNNYFGGRIWNNGGQMLRWPAVHRVRGAVANGRMSPPDRMDDSQGPGSGYRTTMTPGHNWWPLTQRGRNHAVWICNAGSSTSHPGTDKNVYLFSSRISIAKNLLIKGGLCLDFHCWKRSQIAIPSRHNFFRIQYSFGFF